MSSCSSHGGQVSTMDLAGQSWGPWMSRTVGVVLAHQGVGHLTEGLLTLHNLMGHAGINDELKRCSKTQGDRSAAHTKLHGRNDFTHAALSGTPFRPYISPLLPRGVSREVQIPTTKEKGFPNFVSPTPKSSRSPHPAEGET